MDASDLIASAPERIRQCRTAEVELRLSDDTGRIIPHATVDVQLVRHEFKFGCNAFLVGQIADETLQRGYEERLTALLNYATLPFYWGSYEQSKDTTREQALGTMAEWCGRHRIATKGHPLIWHETFPQWGHQCSDDEILTRLERRVRQIVSQFKDRVHLWDVVNEATVSHTFDNAVGRWIARDGAAACVEQALRWAREANPSATLLYNDFNVSPDFEALVGALRDRDAPLDVIGIQSHMHKGRWPLERVWQVCETYARYGLPLHWTELTILSGRLKAADDNDWHTPRTDWKSTPDGEMTQAEYGEQLYTLLFSHPSVEAITWWDFSDYGSWQGAPAGLVREDMTPKPLYERQLNLVKKDWCTDVHTTSDGEGRTRLRCVFGTHRVRATLDTGRTLSGEFTVSRKGHRAMTVALAEG